MNIIERIETLLEQSHTKRGEALEHVYQALGAIFDVVFEEPDGFVQTAVDGVNEEGSPQM